MIIIITYTNTNRFMFSLPFMTTSPPYLEAQFKSLGSGLSLGSAAPFSLRVRVHPAYEQYYFPGKTIVSELSAYSQGISKYLLSCGK